MPLKAVFAGLVPGGEPALRLPGDYQDVVYTSSGSAALVISLMACKIASRRHKVIIPAYTCPSVLAAVERAGLQAVLCDLAPGRLHLDEQVLAGLLDENTLAVVDVHLFGLDRRPRAIKELTKQAGAWFVEDAAQGFGNRTGHGYTGGDGDLAIFSFGRGKPLSALHGGAVLVHSADLAAPVDHAVKMCATALPAWFGIYYRLLVMAYAMLFHPKLFALPQALPWFRIGETLYLDRVPVHCMARPGKRVLAQLLKKRDAIQSVRSKLARRYCDHLRQHESAFAFLPGIGDVISGPLRFPIVFKKGRHKAECLRVLNESRLGASGSYPTTLNMQPGVPAYVVAQGPFPNAEAVASGILTLPTHEYVQTGDIEAMTAAIADVVHNASLI